MNVFWHELRTQRKSLIIWLVVIVVFVFVSLVKFDSIAESGGSAMEIFKNLSPTLLAVFGMNGLDLATLDGYVGVCFIFIAVMAAIFAGMLGANVIAEEETDKTIDFLYPKPVARSHILTQKLLVVALGIVLMATTIYLSVLAATLKYYPDDATLSAFANFGGAALLIMLLAASIGVLFAATIPQSKQSASAVSIVIVVSYFAYALSKMSPSLDWLHYVSVFRWYDAVDILQAGNLAIWSVGVTALVSIAALLAAFVAYSRRDLIA